MSNVYMNGTMTPKTGRKTKQHGEGRVCSNKDCEQVLSRYNENKQCFLHAPRKQPRIRGREDARTKK
tara:strand:+ start:172 stop:372 length:201 start_codon:yes stop_codon:yes gene_type:complete